MMQAHTSDEKKSSAINIDVKDLINKVRELARNVKDIQGNELPVDVNVEGFNFSVGKKDKNFRLVVGLDLGVKRKELKPKK